jgi:hypothetical protein
MGDRWSVVPPPPRTSVDMLGRRHVGAAARRAARAARAWPAVVRAVEVAAVTAVVTLVAFSHTPTMCDTLACQPSRGLPASDSFDTTLDGVRSEV